MDPYQDALLQIEALEASIEHNYNVLYNVYSAYNVHNVLDIMCLSSLFVLHWLPEFLFQILLGSMRIFG